MYRFITCILIISLIFQSCSDSSMEGYRDFQIAPTDTIPYLDTTESKLRPFFITYPKKEMAVQTDTILKDSRSISFLLSTGESREHMICRSLHTLYYQIITERGKDGKFKTDDDILYIEYQLSDSKRIEINGSAFDLKLEAMSAEPYSIDKTDSTYLELNVFLQISTAEKKYSRHPAPYEIAEYYYGYGRGNKMLSCRILINTQSMQVRYDHSYDPQLGMFLDVMGDYTQVKLIYPFQ